VVSSDKRVQADLDRGVLLGAWASLVGLGRAALLNALRAHGSCTGVRHVAVAALDVPAARLAAVGVGQFDGPAGVGFGGIAGVDGASADLANLDTPDA